MQPFSFDSSSLSLNSNFKTLLGECMVQETNDKLEIERHLGFNFCVRKEFSIPSVNSSVTHVFCTPDRRTLHIFDSIGYVHIFSIPDFPNVGSSKSIRAMFALNVSPKTVTHSTSSRYTLIVFDDSSTNSLLIDNVKKTYIRMEDSEPRDKILGACFVLDSNNSSNFKTISSGFVREYTVSPDLKLTKMSEESIQMFDCDVSFFSNKFLHLTGELNRALDHPNITNHSNVVYHDENEEFLITRTRNQIVIGDQTFSALTEEKQPYMYVSGQNCVWVAREMGYSVLFMWDVTLKQLFKAVIGFEVVNSFAVVTGALIYVENGTMILEGDPKISTLFSDVAVTRIKKSSTQKRKRKAGNRKKNIQLKQQRVDTDLISHAAQSLIKLASTTIDT
ncbi:hypothetical protein PCE1_003898 [Barthelona sp. PCE]